MNRLRLLILTSICSHVAFAQIPTAKESITHVNTAVDHITVLEFSDPVTKVAAGSTGFQIERQGNTVFIKPLKTNVSTDLVVWTATSRYAYELDPPGDVKSMNFAIDAPSTKPPITVPQYPTTVADVADMVLIRALLGSQAIDNSRVRDSGPICVKISQIFRSSNSIYMHFRVLNRGTQPAHISVSQVVQLVRAQKAQVSLLGVLNTQLGPEDYQALGKFTEHQVAIARSEVQKEMLLPNEQTAGVVVFRQAVSDPAAFRLTFAAGNEQPITATVVF